VKQEEEIVDNCANVVTYAQHPKTKSWYAFPTACDVPTGWENLAPLPDQFLKESCSKFQTSYSLDEGKIHIPFVYVDDFEKPMFKEVDLMLLKFETPSEMFPTLFYLSQLPPVIDVEEDGGANAQETSGISNGKIFDTTAGNTDSQLSSGEGDRNEQFSN